VVNECHRWTDQTSLLATLSSFCSPSPHTPQHHHPTKHISTTLQSLEQRAAQLAAELECIRRQQGQHAALQAAAAAQAAATQQLQQAEQQLAGRLEAKIAALVERREASLQVLTDHERALHAAAAQLQCMLMAAQRMRARVQGEYAEGLREAEREFKVQLARARLLGGGGAPDAGRGRAGDGAAG